MKSNPDEDCSARSPASYLHKLSRTIDTGDKGLRSSSRLKEVKETGQPNAGKGLLVGQLGRLEQGL